MQSGLAPLLEPDDLACQFIRWIMRENPLEVRTAPSGSSRRKLASVYTAIPAWSTISASFPCEVSPTVGDEDVAVLPTVSEQTLVVCRFSEHVVCLDDVVSA